MCFFDLKNKDKRRKPLVIEAFAYLYFKGIKASEFYQFGIYVYSSFSQRNNAISYGCQNSR